MRASFLAAAAIFAASSASASVLTVGGSFAEGCYRFAESRVGTQEAVSTCDRAFTEQALTSEDQFATYVNRGIVKMHRREFSGAQADFDKAGALNPKRGEPWLNMLATAKTSEITVTPQTFRVSQVSKVRYARITSLATARAAKKSAQLRLSFIQPS